MRAGVGGGIVEGSPGAIATFFTNAVRAVGLNEMPEFVRCVEP